MPLSAASRALGFAVKTLCLLTTIALCMGPSAALAHANAGTCNCAETHAIAAKKDPRDVKKKDVKKKDVKKMHKKRSKVKKTKETGSAGSNTKGVKKQTAKPAVSEPTTTTPISSSASTGASSGGGGTASSTDQPSPSGGGASAPPLQVTTPSASPGVGDPGVSASPTIAAGGTPFIGTFGISSISDMQAWKAAGGNAIVVPISWAAAQPVADGPVSLATAGNNGDDVVNEVQEAHAVGLQVFVEIALQYPPDWVQSQVPEFVNQGGTSYSGGSLASGTLVRDWIFSAVGRQAVASFVGGAMAELAPVFSDVSGFRVGGGQTGELQYPDDGSTVNGQPSFWAYDAPAQTGVGIAAGESPAPIPGYVYGSGTAAQDATFASWYLDSLAAWNLWFIEQLRSNGWNGAIYVLHPSWGIRVSWTPSYGAYAGELAHGADPAVMMSYYKSVPDVHPWCTWADAAAPDYEPSQTNDFNMAPWQELLYLARQDGISGQVIGENTGGGGMTAIDQLMSGALASGYSGVFYLDYQTLVSENLLGGLMNAFNSYK